MRGKRTLANYSEATVSGNRTRRQVRLPLNGGLAIAYGEGAITGLGAGDIKPLFPRGQGGTKGTVNVFGHPLCRVVLPLEKPPRIASDKEGNQRGRVLFIGVGG